MAKSGRQTRECELGAAIMDRARAIELSAQLAEENRLAFARAFSAAIAQAYCRGTAADLIRRNPPAA